MILDKKIEININPRNKTYYEKKGYVIETSQMIKTKICVLVDDLHIGSTTKINIKCDICGSEKKMEYRHYYNNLKDDKKYYCNKCKHIKSKKTKLEKYGDENYNNHDKQKETMLENYGVEFPFQSDLLFKKMLITKKERYGDENYNNISKAKETKLEKYDNENYNNPIKNLKTLNKKLFTTIKNLKKITNHTYEIYCERCEKNYIIYKKNYIDRNHRNRICCTNCNPIESKVSDLEIKLLDFIAENYVGNIISSDRKILNGKELDIYLPDLNLAFEFNGLYWHNELHKDKNYHLNKTEECKKQGIQLFHIYDDDWIYKNDIVKSMILNKIGKTKKKIYARKTIIKEISSKDASIFYEQNHIQGKSSYSINCGLFYNDILVSLMSFKKKKDVYELVRFCNKIKSKSTFAVK